MTCGIADIERNDFCFTDGVGYISIELAARIAKDYNYQKTSAFQVRIAGAKGILMEKKGLEGM